MEECINFSVAAGMMNEKDAAMAKKTKGKGPGGCVGRDACDAFCNNPDNQETCFQFGLENGMIPEEDLRRMEEGRKGMKESFNQMPQEVLDCLTSSLGADMVEKIKVGTAILGPKTGDAMRECFEKFPPQGQMPNGQRGPGMSGQGGGEMPNDLKDCIRTQIGEEGLGKVQSGQMDNPALMEKAKTCFEKFGQQNQQGQPGQQMQPGQSGQMQFQGGPGGCKNPEECKIYCESHQDECKNFQPQQNQQGQPGQNQQGQPGDKFQPRPGIINPGDQQMPQQAGPGGCKGPEECQKYCASNPEECKNFQPGIEGQSGGMAPGTFRGAPGNVVCEDPAKCPQAPQPGESKSIEGRAMPPCEGENCVQRPSSDQGGIFRRIKNTFMPNAQKGQQLMQGREGTVQPSQTPPQGTNTSGQYIQGQPGQPGQRESQMTPTESNPSPAPMPTPGQPGTYIQGQSGQFGGQMTPTESNPSPAPMPTPGQPGTYIQQNQTGQMIPAGQVAPSGVAPIEGGIVPQQTPPPPPSTSPPPPPSSFIQRLLGSVIDLFGK